MLSATSFQITLLSRRNWQNDLELYVLGAVFVASSVVWYALSPRSTSFPSLGSPSDLRSSSSVCHPSLRLYMMSTILSSAATWCYTAASAADRIRIFRPQQHFSGYRTEHPHYQVRALLILTNGSLTLSLSSYITGIDEYSNGIVPTLRAYDATARYAMNQGENRHPGAFAAYPKPSTPTYLNFSA